MKKIIVLVGLCLFMKALSGEAYAQVPTNTPIFTRTFTATFTRTPTATFTKTPTNTFTPTNTATPTFTNTPTFTFTPSGYHPGPASENTLWNLTYGKNGSVVNVALSSPVPTSTGSATPTNTPTGSNTPTPTFTPTFTLTPTPPIYPYTHTLFTVANSTPGPGTAVNIVPTVTGQVPYVVQVEAYSTSPNANTSCSFTSQTTPVKGPVPINSSGGFLLDNTNTVRMKGNSSGDISIVPNSACTLNGSIDWYQK